MASSGSGPGFRDASRLLRSKTRKRLAAQPQRYIRLNMMREQAKMSASTEVWIHRGNRSVGQIICDSLTGLRLLVDTREWADET
jgi:hypothetical protein